MEDEGTDGKVEGETGESGRTGRRKAGTGFPVVSLAEAASILKEAGKYGFEHTTAAFAGYMGHSTTNSGAFRQRLAAFRDWRLVTGRGDNLAMTEIGKMIALPTDSDSERRALRDAFHSYPVFSKLYEGSAKGTALAPKGIGNRAVHEFGVAPSSVSRFVDSFIASAEAAGLAEVTDDEQVRLLTDDGLAPGVQPPEAALPPSPGESSERAPRPRPDAPVVHQSWAISGGTIIFEIRREEALPAAAFATVGEVVASLENLASTLTPETPETAPVVGDEEQ